jgi:hypothetical protein
MRSILIIVALVAVCQVAVAQTIRRVNNNLAATGLNVYTTVQAAHDAAAANDIIIIEPSIISYGSLISTKPLKIYGNGYFLTTNTELRLDTRPSTVVDVTFATASSGSYIAGVSIAGSVTIKMANDITVTRCYLGSLTIDTRNLANSAQANISNHVISGNCFTGGIGVFTSGFTITNISVTNNIIRDLSAAAGNDIQAWIVRNNSFFNNTGYPGLTISLNNSVFENNLLTPSTTSYGYILSFTNTTYSYNAVYNNLFTPGNGNINNVDFPSEFVAPGGLSDDEKYQLINTSALKTAGSGGTEIGAFGGATPYVISGIPPIPSISNMVHTATGSDVVDLQVTISVKSNN